MAEDIPDITSANPNNSEFHRLFPLPLSHHHYSGMEQPLSRLQCKRPGYTMGTLSSGDSREHQQFYLLRTFMVDHFVLGLMVLAKLICLVPFLAFNNFYFLNSKLISRRVLTKVINNNCKSMSRSPSISG